MVLCFQKLIEVKPSVDTLGIEKANRIILEG